MVTKGSYTCIFGGGAVRGFAYIGAIKALEELDINIKTYAGSSVGSIIAGLLAVGCQADEIKEILNQVNFELFRDIHFGLNKEFAISKGNLFTDWIREAIEKKFYGNDYIKGENKPVTFGDLKKHLVILTTDLNNFCPVEFSTFCTPDYEIASAIRISCSMPGLMTPVEINDKRLIDGDLLKGIPLWKLSENINTPDTRIIEFRLEGDTVSKEGNMFEFLNSIYSCMTSVSTDFIMDTFGENDKFDYVKITTGDIIIIDFNLSDEVKNSLVEMGYKDSIKQLTQQCIHKKRLITKYYNKMIEYLTKLIRALKYNNIQESIDILKDLFLYISDVYRYIDSDIFENIWTLKNDILNAPRKKSWFHGEKYKNKEILIDNAYIIKKVLSTKTDELQDYINCVR